MIYQAVLTIAIEISPVPDGHPEHRVLAATVSPSGLHTPVAWQRLFHWLYDGWRVTSVAAAGSVPDETAILTLVRDE